MRKRLVTSLRLTISLSTGPALSAATFKPAKGRRHKLRVMENVHVNPSTHHDSPIASLLRYKRWADADLIQTALALPASFPAKELGYIAAIIRHYHTVDCIFRAHLLGIPHQYTSPNPPEPATLAELQTCVAEIDDWYVSYVSKLDQRALGEVLQVTFTDGAQQFLSRADILLHISQHGTGHRGQAALLLKVCGFEAPPDRFANYVRSVQ